MSTEYVCPRCNYASPYKNNMRSHYKRKHPCMAVYDDTSIDELLEQLNAIDDEAYKFACTDCCKRFSTRQGLYVHKKTYHKATTVEDSLTKNLLKRIEDLERKLSVAATTTNNNITIMNIATGQFPAHKNNFGQESLDHLTHDYKRQCLLMQNEGIINLLKYIYFNPNVPENYNVMFKSNDKVLIWVDGQWMEADRRTTTDAMLQKSHSLLFSIFSSGYISDVDINRNSEQLLKWLTDIGSRSDISYFDLKRDVPLMIKNNTPPPPPLLIE